MKNNKVSHFGKNIIANLLCTGYLKEDPSGYRLSTKSYGVTLKGMWRCFRCQGDCYHCYFNLFRKLK